MSDKEWLIRKHYEEQMAQFRTTWTLYLQFYTLFLAANVTALGLVAEHLSGRAMIISMAFAIQDALLLLTSLGMARYSSRVAKDVATASLTLLRGDNADEELVSVVGRPPMPFELAPFAGLANAVGCGSLVICWLVVGRL